MKFTLWRQAVGLDVGERAIKALRVEGRGRRLLITGVGVATLEAGADPPQVTQAIHAALVAAGADGEPVVAAVGGPEVVIRQVSLPALPPSRILPALEMQHRDFGLLPPEVAVLDAQLLKRSKEGATTAVLAVSAPRPLIEERIRLLEQAAVNLKILDVEPLALLNGALHLTGLDPGELLVALTVGQRSSVLCLLSERCPVVARYLEIGAEDFAEPLRVAFGGSPFPPGRFARTLSGPDLTRAREACGEVIARMAEEVRMSLSFCRSEFDRESLPRYALGGWAGLPTLGQWLAEQLGLDAPFELMDPLQAVEVKAKVEAELPGPEFLQAFGLALRGL